MPINSLHPQYQANIERWTRCRDAYEGEDAVKAKGEKYLPKCDPTQTGDEYEAYKKRALFYEAVSRTVDGFVGAISRKPHTIELPDTLNDLLTDATTDGTGLDEFIKKLASETALQGRGGVLVDFDEDEQRPYLALYNVESITNWTSNSVVLMETVYEAAQDDPYSQVAIDQIRQLEMVDGTYTVTLWRKAATPGATGPLWEKYQETTPTKRGQTIDELPWFWFSSMGQSSKISKPPMLGLINTALSHYRSSADLEHGRHFTALPTLYITGITSDDPIRVGAGSVIKLEKPDAKVGYAEFTGQGLNSLETALSSKETMMAMLGAAVFGSSKKGVEAAETARIAKAGETSLLMGVVSAVEETLVAALDFAASWMDGGGTATIKINRDFIDQQLNPQTLVGMVQAYQAGTISMLAFQYCLQQAEMLPPETDIAAEAAKLLAAGPPAPPTPAVPPTKPVAPEAQPNRGAE